MVDGYRRLEAAAIDPTPEKPGTRRELADALDLEAFNLNVATLAPGDRLSQNHYHYHEHQHELCYVIGGRCRVEVHDGGFVLAADGAVRFTAGEAGVHVLYNPFEAPCRVLALGWPPEGRFPVRQVRTVEGLLAERYGGEPPLE